MVFISSLSFQSGCLCPLLHILLQRISVSMLTPGLVTHLTSIFTFESLCFQALNIPSPVPFSLEPVVLVCTTLWSGDCHHVLGEIVPL